MTRFLPLTALLLALTTPALAETLKLGARIGAEPPAATSQATTPQSKPQAAPNKPNAAQSALLDAAMKAVEGNLALMNGDTEAGNKALSEAVAGYDAVLKTEPDNTRALSGRGMTRNLLQDDSGNSDLERVVALADATIAKDGKNAEAFHERAAAYRALDNYTAARKDYQTAIAMKPERSNWPLDLRAMEAEVKLHEALSKSEE
ncbi:MAG: hypothetical protein KBA75_04525 [Alphaproteobacteria bacterium]|nr:hypothetical protein [Alphaproteobacteria bacterium]